MRLISQTLREGCSSTHEVRNAIAHLVPIASGVRAPLCGGAHLVDTAGTSAALSLPPAALPLYAGSGTITDQDFKGLNCQLETVLKGSIIGCSSNGFLTVPLMQRPFVWSKKEVGVFITRILAGFDKAIGWQHLGSIFLWRQDKHRHEFDVLDGSHRVHCIFFTLAVLRHIRNLHFTHSSTNKDKLTKEEPYFCLIKLSKHNSMFFREDAKVPRFLPKIAQRSFFNIFITPEEDNLGKLWTDGKAGQPHETLDFTHAKGDPVLIRYMWAVHTIYHKIDLYYTTRRPPKEKACADRPAGLATTPGTPPRATPTATPAAAAAATRGGAPFPPFLHCGWRWWRPLPFFAPPAGGYEVCGGAFRGNRQQPRQGRRRT